MVEKPRKITLTITTEPGVPFFEKQFLRVAKDSFLISIGRRGKVGSRYKVLSVRPVKTKDGAHRFAFIVVRVPSIPKNAMVLDFQWHQRTRKEKQ